MNDSGKVSVSEVCQNDLAFRMNTSSRKVFQECLVGIIITESKREREREREREKERERGAESEDEEASE